MMIFFRLERLCIEISRASAKQVFRLFWLQSFSKMFGSNRRLAESFWKIGALGYEKQVIEKIKSIQNGNPHCPYSVVDSNAKLTSGILNGNVNQYGDFDQCLESSPSSGRYQSQYCLAQIQLKVLSDDSVLKDLLSLSLSFEAYKSNLEDVSFEIFYDEHNVNL